MTQTKDQIEAAFAHWMQSTSRTLLDHELRDAFFAGQAIAQQGVPEDAALADLQKEVDTLRSLLNARPAMNAGLPVAYAEWTGMVYAHSMGLLDAPSQTH